jgi:hypothetical protein
MWHRACFQEGNFARFALGGTANFQPTRTEGGNIALRLALYGSQTASVDFPAGRICFVIGQIA